MDGATLIGWFIDGDSRVPIYWRDGEYVAESQTVPFDRLVKWSETGHFSWVSDRTHEWFVEVQALQRKLGVPPRPTPQGSLLGESMPPYVRVGLAVASVGLLCMGLAFIQGMVLFGSMFTASMPGSPDFWYYFPMIAATLVLLGAAVWVYWLLSRYWLAARGR